MQQTDRDARIAGAIYVLLTIMGIFGLMYVPSVVFVHGDASATIAKILAHETLFRVGIVSGAISNIVFIFLGLALYRLFCGVNKNLASVMLILVLVSGALGFVSELNQIGTLIFARGGDDLAAFDQAQRDALAMFFVRLDGQFTLLNEIFWGLWLFPFGMLVYRSGFLPRTLGVWLIINGVAYLCMSFAGLLLPQYASIVSTIAFPALFGEMAIALWLLILGARVRPGAAAEALAQA